MLIFDVQAGGFRSVNPISATAASLAILPSKSKANEKKRKKLAEANRVEIEIARDSNTSDLQGVLGAMNKVFLSNNEHISDVVPSCWRNIMRRIEKRPVEPFPTVDIYQVGKDITAPVPIYDPNPEFRDRSPEAPSNGEMWLSIVVNKEGLVADPEITRPLGIGLDEKALESVQKWKFKPGRKNGQPIAVRIQVQVSFHLT